MDSAPKDGTPVDLWLFDYMEHSCRFKNGFWRTPGGDRIIQRMDAWRPIPAGPFDEE